MKTRLKWVALGLLFVAAGLMWTTVGSSASTFRATS